jgi:L-fuconolactonase
LPDVTRNDADEDADVIALEPDLRIIDPHHHMWDDGRAPQYLLDELLEDTSTGHRIEETIYVETGWGWDSNPEHPGLAPIAEIRRVAEIAEESARRRGTVIAGIIGHVNLRDKLTVDRALDDAVVAGRGRLVGIRHSVAWDASDQVERHRTLPPAGLLRDPDFRRGLSAVADRNLVYDVWMYHPQLPELTEAARTLPNLPIVLNHLGGPLAVGPYREHLEASRNAWRQNMRDLSSCDNVYLKLGGIGIPMLADSWQEQNKRPSARALARHWNDRIRWCIDTFGPERCMFESNFPVDKKTCSYSALWNTFKLISADTTTAEKAALFGGTAKKVYFGQSVGVPPAAATDPVAIEPGGRQ